MSARDDVRGGSVSAGGRWEERRLVFAGRDWRYASVLAHPTEKQVSGPVARLGPQPLRRRAGVSVAAVESVGMDEARQRGPLEVRLSHPPAKQACRGRPRRLPLIVQTTSEAPRW